jgi:flagellar basal-body rod modification protein FlgD
MIETTATTGAGPTYLPNSSTKASSENLGQKDFLTLMAAQLQNQDPFAPMENGEFLAQMAQFSTVSGLETVNQTLAGIGEKIGGNRIATASSLMGQHVLVPGTTARPDAEGSIHGVADLPQAASTVTVLYTHAETGAELHRQEMGAQPAGLMGFDWSDLPDDMVQARDAVRVTVMTDGPEPASPFVYARVIGVQLPQDSDDLTLDVEDYGLRNSLEITSIR